MAATATANIAPTAPHHTLIAITRGQVERYKDNVVLECITTGKTPQQIELPLRWIDDALEQHLLWTLSSDFSATSAVVREALSDGRALVIGTPGGICEWIWVDPKFRRQGLGRALMTAGGFTKVDIIASSEGRAFFAALGIPDDTQAMDDEECDALQATLAALIVEYRARFGVSL